MNKDRLETFSDGVFAIVMTLLVVYIRIPSLPAPVTDGQLWAEISALVPSVIVFAVTFAVLSVFWINHHFLFHSFIKTIDRQINLLNLLYLMFVVFIPFTADLIGTYPTHQPAAILYGVNILCIVLISVSILTYARRRPEFLHEGVSTRLIKQARVRGGVSLFFYVLGLLCTFISVPLSIFFYAFPVIFNIIPGSLDLAERLFGFTLE